MTEQHDSKAARVAELERLSQQIGLCICESPMVRCDHRGCMCEMCGKPDNNLYGAELSRLRKGFPQPKRRDGEPPCGECHLQPGETCDVCGAVSFSHLPAREAIEDLRTHRESWREALVKARDTADQRLPDVDDKRYWQHELDVFDRTFAALQPLSQGNGEAVDVWDALQIAHGALICIAESELGALVCTAESELLDPRQYARKVADDIGEILYPAPPSQSTGVREALEAAAKALETEAEKAFCEGGKLDWRANDFNKAADIVRSFVGATTPSPGLVEAAEWHEQTARDCVRRIEDECFYWQDNLFNSERAFHLISNAIRRTLSAKGEAAAEWQPIETAPDDREWTASLPFDLWEGPSVAYSDDENQEEPLFLVWYSQTGLRQAQTSHWMPLPAPPRTLSAKPSANADGGRDD